MEGIGADCFSNCSSLKRIELPDGLKAISYRAFSDWSGGEYIKIPESVTLIQTESFKNTSNTLKIDFANPNDWVYYRDRDADKERVYTEISAEILSDPQSAAAALQGELVNYTLIKKSEIPAQ